MSLTDFLIGDSSLKRQRDRAIDMAQEKYDPSMFTPLLDESRARATEGIGEAGNIARARTVQSLFSPSSFSTQTGNQGRALALQSQQTQARSQALADVESQLSQADIQARQQGQRQFAQARSQQLQTEGLREAAEDEAQMMYEAERDRRVQSLVGGAIGLAGTLATTPFGAVDAVAEIRDEEGNIIQEGTEGKPARSLVQRGLGALFGGGGQDETPSFGDGQGRMQTEYSSEALQAFGDQARSDVSVDSIFGQQTQPNARDFLEVMSQDWQQQGSVAPTANSQQQTLSTNQQVTGPSRDMLMQGVDTTQPAVSTGEFENDQTTSLENLSRAVQAQDGLGDQTGLGELIFKGIQSGTLDPFKQYGNLLQAILEPYMRERERLRTGFE